jgi:hypothetical protein
MIVERSIPLRLWRECHRAAPRAHQHCRFSRCGENLAPPLGGANGMAPLSAKGDGRMVPDMPEIGSDAMARTSTADRRTRSDAPWAGRYSKLTRKLRSRRLPS